MSGVAGEGSIVGVPKFHSWGKCTMPLTNINSDWMSNASSGLRIIGASLSEPHTSGTALRKCVYVRTYIRACLRPYTVNFKCVFKYFPKIEMLG